MTSSTTPFDKMNTNIAIQEHDGKCKEEWRQCPCAFAVIIRKQRQEPLDDKERISIGLPLASLENPFICSQEEKKQIYLRNIGLGIIHRNIKDLSDDEIFDRVHLLDQATRDEAFKRSKKARDGVQECIDRLRTIKQGMYDAENALLNKLDISERLNQTRKDKVYKPKKEISKGDSTKQKQKVSVEDKLKKMGIDLTALRAEAMLKMSAAEAAQKKEGAK